MAKHVYGASKLSRQLKRMPDDVTVEVKKAIAGGAEELRQEMERTAPRDTGDLAAAAGKKVSRSGLSAQVGYSNSAGFRRQWKRGGFVALYKEFGTVSQPAEPFVRPAYRNKLRSILDRIDAAVTAALKKVSQG